MIKIIDKSIVLDIIKNLLKDKSASKNPNIDIVIYSLLKPYIGRRKLLETNFPKEIGSILDKTVRDNGFCTNCRSNKIEKKEDTTCSICKRKIKNACKEKLEEEFYSL